MLFRLNHFWRISPAQILKWTSFSFSNYLFAVSKPRKNVMQLFQRCWTDFSWLRAFRPHLLSIQIALNTFHIKSINHYQKEIASLFWKSWLVVILWWKIILRLIAHRNDLWYFFWLLYLEDVELNIIYTVPEIKISSAFELKLLTWDVGEFRVLKEGSFNIQDVSGLFIILLDRQPSAISSLVKFRTEILF